MRARLVVATWGIFITSLLLQACSQGLVSNDTPVELRQPRVILLGDTAFWSIFCYGGEPLEVDFVTDDMPNDPENRSGRCTDFTGIVTKGLNGEIEPIETEQNRRQRGYYFDCGSHPHPKFGTSKMISHYLFVFTQYDSTLTMLAKTCRLISEGDSVMMLQREIDEINQATEAAPPPKPLTASLNQKKVTS